MSYQDDWQWSQYDHHEAVEWQLTDIEQAAFIKSQQEINSRLGMTFDELIASMQSGDMKRQALGVVQ